MNEVTEKRLKKKKDTTTEQINRSLGYLISIAGDAQGMFEAMIAAEPLLNRKLVKRLSATLHVIHKVKSGKTPNEAPAGISN